MALARAWRTGKRGSMAPIEQAKLWALRTIVRKQGEDDDKYAWMVTQVRVVGGGHPGREAVRLFFQLTPRTPHTMTPHTMVPSRGNGGKGIHHC